MTSEADPPIVVSLPATVDGVIVPDVEIVDDGKTVSRINDTEEAYATVLPARSLALTHTFHDPSIVNAASFVLGKAPVYDNEPLQVAALDATA